MEVLDATYVFMARRLIKNNLLNACKNRCSIELTGISGLLERISDMDYQAAIAQMSEKSLVAMLLTAINLLSCEDSYLTMSKQEIFNLICVYSFGEREE